MPILDSTRKLILLSGKGGVGKTTLSAALSQQIAADSPHQRFLLVSTDPAHSLGDIWQCPVGDVPTPLSANLEVRALDAARLLADFKAKYVPALSLIAERASWLEQEDLVPLWDLTWPGVDELMALLEINRLLASQTVDTVILDTAPTGHTLRLLALPDFLDNLLGVFQAFQDKHRALQEHFGGHIRPDSADQFLQEIQQDLRDGHARLRDPQSTGIWLVMLPEAMSLAETERFRAELTARKLPIQGIIVNQIVTAASPRYPAQQDHLHRLQKDLGPTTLWGVPWLSHEPLGSLALAELVTQIQPLEHFSPPLAATNPLDNPLGTPLICPPLPSLRLSQQLPTTLRLLICGGKGGVGKTTVAASLAWALAQGDPARRMLVVSIDPAHSLGDCFGVDLGQTPTGILTNLWAEEMDATLILDQFRQDYLEDMVAILASETEQVSLNYDALAWRRLLDMPPPGLDEIMALITLLSAQDAYDLIVVDSAPTGHLLRFLEMPTALEGWLDLALKLWLKYRDRVGRVELAQRLRTLRQQVRLLHTQLQDPQFTCFIPVLNPEQAVLAETARLLVTLKDIGIPHPWAVLNRVASDPGDPLFSKHKAILNQINVPLITLPYHPDPRPEVLAAYI